MSSRRADLYPPLGTKGGPCKVVERILTNVKNVRDRDELIRAVEENKDLTNEQAALVYKPERERGVPPFTPLNFTSHAQYRMDLRGITVPDVLKSLSRFRDELLNAKMTGNSRAMEKFRADPTFNDSEGHRTVVLGPQEDRLNVVSVFPYPYKDNPRTPPGGCSHTAGYRAPAGELSGYRTYPSEKPTKGIYRSLGDTVEHPPGESPKGDRSRARPQSTDTKENLENHTPGNWAYNAPGPSSDGQKVPVRTVGKPGEQYGHPYKNNITPRRTEANGEFPPYSERQKKQRGEAKLYAKKYYLRHRGKIKNRAKIDYLHKRNSPSFKREKKYRNSEKFGWRFNRLPSGGYRSNAERARDNRAKKAQEILIPFTHPNYGVGYVLDVVDQEVVIRQTDSLGGPVLGEGTVPIFTFLRGAEFDSELDIDAFFTLADRDFGYVEESRTADFHRQTYRPGDLLDPGEGVRDLGEPSPYAPILRYPDTDRNYRKPGEKMDSGQVDNNPGSAKVIPSGHGFANKEAGSRPYLNGPGIVVSRLGGWSPVAQTNERAPEERGVWAFIYPYFEPYFVASTDAEGVVYEEDESGVTVKTRPSRYVQMKARTSPSNNLKKARYEGMLYTRIRVPGGEVRGGWCYVDADILRKYVFGKYHTELYTEFASQWRSEYGRGENFKPMTRTQMPRVSADGFEVFIPANQGRLLRFTDPGSQRVAAKMADILKGIDPGIRSKAKSIKPAMQSSNEKKLSYQFRVPSSDGGSYTVKVQAEAPEGVTELSKMDLKVSCTCGFWQFQGPEHHAQDDGYLLGTPRGTAMPPGVKDPRGMNRVCKHVAAVFNQPVFKGR